jgi:hypothetical protein
MNTTTTTPPISKTVLRALTTLTGEPRFDVALHLALKDSIDHRLDKINKAIHDLEQKYGMSFEQFMMQGEAGTLPDQFSFEVERDYLEWDGLMSRKHKIEKIGQWLI